MMHCVQIGGNVVAVFDTEENGKVTWLDVRVFPLPYWNKHILSKEEQ